MRKTIILFFALLVQLTAWAQLGSGHFFKSLQNENLTEGRAVECFDQWFALPHKWGDSSLNNVVTPKTRQKFRERQKEKVADYSTTMLYNVLTVRNLLSACFKRLQGQLLRLTTLRCRDEATRTPDPYVPNVVRYQLRYIPIFGGLQKNRLQR